MDVGVRSFLAKMVIVLALLAPGIGFSQVQLGSDATPGTLSNKVYSSPVFTGFMQYNGGSINAATQNTLGSFGAFVFGTRTSSGTCPQALYSFCTTDEVDTVTAGGSNLIGLGVTDSINTGATGGREAFQAELLIQGSPTPSSSLGYIGATFIADLATTLGGTSGSYSTYAGGAFGANCNVFTSAAATFIGLINCQEFDVSVPTGASLAEKHAATFVLAGSDAVRGTYDDTAIELDEQDVVTDTWKYGFAPGGYGHRWPFGADSTIFYAWARQTGPSSPSIALWGMDFSNVAFSTATLTGIAITGTAGQFSCTCTGMIAGMTVVLSGTYGGGGSITGYSNSTAYLVSVTNGTSTFTLTTLAGAAIVTTAGTPTGLTYMAAGGFLKSTGYMVDALGNDTANSYTGPIGGTAPYAGAFTTLSASSTVSGAGFSTYLASPPAIGGSSAAAVTGTTVTATTTVAAPIGSSTSMGFSYSGNIKTGIYFPSANQVEICGNGACQVNINGSGLLALNAGLSVSAGATTLSALSTGTAADTLCLTSGGVVILQTAACTISSRRFKEHIKTFKEDALSQINLLEVMSYNMKPGDVPNKDKNFGAKQVGLIAEDIAQVMPQCAIYEQDMKTPQSYRQECVIAMLVKGEQELIAQNGVLKARLAKLEHRSH